MLCFILFCFPNIMYIHTYMHMFVLYVLTYFAPVSSINERKQMFGFSYPFHVDSCRYTLNRNIKDALWEYFGALALIRCVPNHNVFSALVINTIDSLYFICLYSFTWKYVLRTCIYVLFSAVPISWDFVSFSKVLLHTTFTKCSFCDSNVFKESQ